MSTPLADRMRPQLLEDVVGQEHLLAEGCMLRRIIESEQIPNLIFYGPSGVGKTTIARIIAQNTQKLFCYLNATSATTADLRAVFDKREQIDGRNGVLLYLDEIQYLNKKQQQTLLEYLEDGSITLIAATTENPYFYIYSAILSRSTIFEFKLINRTDIQKATLRAFQILGTESNHKFNLTDGVVQQIAAQSGGDVRHALNMAEIIWNTASEEKGEKILTPEAVAQLHNMAYIKYDKDGDAHFDILSAFQKSIRGSDENAALHYLARLLEAGDLISPCRRLLVTASEDIGLAYPQAISIVKACVDSAMQVGLPEARIPLAQAVILLATSPKSNSAASAIDAAIEELRSQPGAEIPAYLKDCHYSGAQDLGRGIGYQYPHDFPNHYIKQQYLPDTLCESIYYQYGKNKTEQAAQEYWRRVKK